MYYSCFSCRPKQRDDCEADDHRCAVVAHSPRASTLRPLRSASPAARPRRAGGRQPVPRVAAHARRGHCSLASVHAGQGSSGWRAPARGGGGQAWLVVFSSVGAYWERQTSEVTCPGTVLWPRMEEIESSTPSRPWRWRRRVWAMWQQLGTGKDGEVRRCVRGAGGGASQQRGAARPVLCARQPWQRF